MKKRNKVTDMLKNVYHKEYTGKIIRMAMEANEWTVEALAEAIGITSDSLSRIRRGKANASIETILRVIYCLELDATVALIPPKYRKTFKNIVGDAIGSEYNIPSIDDMLLK